MNDERSKPAVEWSTGQTTMSAEPAIRAHLRGRLPGRIRTARGTLFVLAGYAFLFDAVLLFMASGGAFARFGIPTGTALVVGVFCLGLGLLAVASANGIRRRARWGYLLGLVTGAIGLVVGLAIVALVVTGGSGLDGNPAFFVVLLALFFAMLGAAIAYNLVRAAGWARTMGDVRIIGTTSAQQLAEEIAIGPAVEPVPGQAPAEAPAAGARRKGPLLAVRGLKKHFPIYGGLLKRQIATVYAVDGVDFDVFPGEIFSLVGESGCGKTTLGRTLLQLTPPTEGKVVFDGYELEDVDPDDMRPLRRRMQIIFQDPFGSLNPRMPISDIIGEGLLAQGLTDRRARDKKVEDSLEVVGLRRDYTRRYPHEFSGGQRQRIGVARALALGPDFIVCDEPVSALDVSIQSQVLNLLLDLRRDFNLTYLFISHNLSVVQYFSDRVGVMYLGKIAELGTVEQLYRNPRHPYTVALLSAIPEPDPRRRKRRLVLKGDVPSPAAPPSGCRFHTRCWLRERLGNPERCVTDDPALRTLQPGHQAACHFAEEITQESVEEAATVQSVVETAVADLA